MPICLLDALDRVCREIEAASGEILPHQVIQSRLVDRRFAALEHLDLVRGERLVTPMSAIRTWPSVTESPTCSDD